ncbi:hypothetical protein B0T14DRAFT_558801 [Immersiella caudata]|uniref:Uncharacterized protein n=1 Tax=Immersiella caudata TaxID=314043 RepID=A0AA39TLU6_9PEZI|nr:hypothetical protein B0T14DRAFT_558801 [Immersiella caudata]
MDTPLNIAPEISAPSAYGPPGPMRIPYDPKSWRSSLNDFIHYHSPRFRGKPFKSPSAPSGPSPNQDAHAAEQARASQSQVPHVSRVSGSFVMNPDDDEEYTGRSLNPWETSSDFTDEGPYSVVIADNKRGDDDDDDHYQTRQNDISAEIEPIYKPKKSVTLPASTRFLYRATPASTSSLRSDASLVTLESYYSLPGLSTPPLNQNEHLTLSFRRIRARYVRDQAKKAPGSVVRRNRYPHLFKLRVSAKDCPKIVTSATNPRLSYPLVKSEGESYYVPRTRPGPARVVYPAEEHRRMECEVWYHDPRVPIPEGKKQHPFRRGEYRAGRKMVGRVETEPRMHTVKSELLRRTSSGLWRSGSGLRKSSSWLVGKVKGLWDDAVGVMGI